MSTYGILQVHQNVTAYKRTEDRKIYLLHSFGHRINKLVFPFPARLAYSNWDQMQVKWNWIQLLLTLWPMFWEYQTTCCVSCKTSLWSCVLNWLDFNLSQDLSPLDARSCSMWRVTTRRNLRQVDKKMCEQFSLTYLMFPPSSSTLAPGSTRLSCRSLKNNLCQNASTSSWQYPPVLLFSSLVLPVLLQPSACILSPPRLAKCEEGSRISCTSGRFPELSPSPPPSPQEWSHWGTKP